MRNRRSFPFTIAQSPWTILCQRITSKSLGRSRWGHPELRTLIPGPSGSLPSLKAVRRSYRQAIGTTLSHALRRTLLRTQYEAAIYPTRDEVSMFLRCPHCLMEKQFQVGPFCSVWIPFWA